MAQSLSSISTIFYLAIRFLSRKNNQKKPFHTHELQKLIDGIIFRELQQARRRPKGTDDSGNIRQKDTQPLLFEKCKRDVFFPGTVTRLQNHWHNSLLNYNKWHYFCDEASLTSFPSCNKDYRGIH